MSRCTGDLATWQGVFCVALLPNPHLQIKAANHRRRSIRRSNIVHLSFVAVGLVTEHLKPSRLPVKHCRAGMHGFGEFWQMLGDHAGCKA